ncbi:hypothetical protein ABPG74_013868 [Tetrahymena malaccensis]
MSNNQLKDIQKHMSITTGNLNSIKGHVQIMSQKENKDNEDLQLLYGRLQYQVKQLEMDIKNQSNAFSKTLSQTGGFNLKSNESIQNTTARMKGELQKYEKQKSFNETNPMHFSQYSSAKDLMSASKGFLSKTAFSYSMSQTNRSLQKAQSQTNFRISGQSELNNNSQRSFYQTKNSLAKPGRISNTDILPRHIRKNPFADLPPISEKDLQKGLFNLVNIGLIPKDLDLLPAFNQGAPILEATKKIQISPDYKLQKVNFPEREFPEKYKLDYNINNASSILPLSQLHQSISQQNMNLIQNQETNIFITDTNTQSKQIQNQNQLKKRKSNFKFNTAQYLLQNQPEQPKQVVHKEIVVQRRFYLTIKNGYIIKGAQDYKVMKTYYTEQWGSVNSLIKKLEDLCKKYDIKLLHINGMKLLEIVNDLTRTRLNDLVECVINKDMIKKIIPAENMSSFRGKAWATIKILCSFKMKKAIKELKKMREKQNQNAEKKWKVMFWLRYMITQRRIKSIQNGKLSTYYALQESFKQNYSYIMQSKRIEIHINSLSYDEFKRNTTEHFDQRESIQLTRIFSIKDPNIEVIIVLPYELPHEIISYYYKICELGDIIDYKERIHFIFPENAHLFPKFSTVKLLYYSPLALKKIKDLIQNKNAYIVPGVPCKEDNLVGMALKIPIFCGNYDIVNNLCKKSQAKQLFEECKFPTAPGAENIFDEEDLINKLTILIAKYSNVNTWVFKIDGEFKGRGIAFFSLESIRVLSDIRKQKKEIDESQVSKIREIVSSLLPSKTLIAIPTLFQNYQEFLYYFLEHKGIIEASPLCSQEEVASPSVFFRLDPDGQTHVLASYDKIQGQDFVNFGNIFPQQSLPSLNLKQLCSSLGEKLCQKGIYGYITVDMIAFPDPSNKLNHPLFWLIGLDCYLNDYSSAFFIFDFLSKGKIDKITGRYYLGGNIPEKILPEENEQENEDSEKSNIIDEFEERSFMYIPYIFHRGFNTMGYRDFFQLCRKNSISFDIEKKQGSVFLLIDNIENGVLSLMTISENSRKNIKFMTDALNFILQIVGVVQRKTQKDLYKRTDQIYLMDIISKVRNLNKNNEKQINYFGSVNSPQNNNQDKSY